MCRYTKEKNDFAPTRELFNLTNAPYDEAGSSTRDTLETNSNSLLLTI